MTLHPARGAAFFVSAVAVQLLLPSFFAIFSPGCLKNGHSNVVGFNFRNGCVVLNQYNE